MPTSQKFLDHALELLSGVGPVSARSMFGGHGVSVNGVGIGLIDDNLLFLRTDDATRARFEAAGSRAFTYPGKKGPVTMKNYWTLPDDALDDPDQALIWGRLALEAGLRAVAAKPKPKPKPKSTPKPRAAKSAVKSPRSKPRASPAKKAKGASPSKTRAAPARSGKRSSRSQARPTRRR